MSARKTAARAPRAPRKTTPTASPKTTRKAAASKTAASKTAARKTSRKKAAATPVVTAPVVPPAPDLSDEAVAAAARRLGIEELYLEQRQVIRALFEGNDVLMVLPTGFGKSACYQVPSMLLPRPALVVSPLLALMRDQYEKLLRLEIPCVRLDGTIRGRNRRAVLDRISAGGPLLVMTTPETLASDDAAGALSKSGISLAAVDEAHCVSEWGYDFRPAYLQIGERLRALGAPPVLALTATATTKVRTAIERFVGMRSPVVVAASPHRSNLAFDVLRCSGQQRLRALLRLALRLRRPGIIYCSTTKEVDEIWALLQRFGIRSYRYHGKMTSTERAKQQDGFMKRGRRSVMVATNAFGLGIDKPDIRYVMHYQSPASLEQYVQEAGRAGRDGRRSNCVLLQSDEDRLIHEALLARSRVRPDQLYKLGRALAAWAGEEKSPSLSALALSADLGTRTTGALLALLEEAEIVRWDPESVEVRVPADEVEERGRRLAGQFETLRTEDARRLDAVAAYAAGDEGCRAIFLCAYFGEETPDPCGLCDVCRGAAERPSQFFEPLDPPKNLPVARATSRGTSRPIGRRRGQGPPASEERTGKRRRGRRPSNSRRGRDRARQPASASFAPATDGADATAFQPGRHEAPLDGPPQTAQAAPGEGTPRRRRRRRRRRWHPAPPGGSS